MAIPRLRPFAVIAKSGAQGLIKDGDPHGPDVRATVKDYANAKPVAVVLVDTNGTAYSASASGTTPPATATRSSVADNAAAVELLAANANRLGLVITNDSSADLFVGLGTVDPTTTNYTFLIHSGQTWQMTELFTGQLKGIWRTDPNDGAARITELTA